ncbi:MAG: formylglycine-generating enzyme family protein [Bacteroidetes bacterium]|nr:formylglycine-generating enzyme family protein [Bacteroidota bacterium]MCL2302579.1 formylglycine-generating enzyme family protein [Lentimicrobiaceae bacterium]
MKRTILNLFTVVLLLMIATSSCKKEPVSGITLEPSLLYFNGVGQTETLTTKIMPANAANQKVNWESSDNNVATVHNGMVTSISFGKATITVTTQDGNRTAKCFVTVYDPSTLPEMIFVEGGTFTRGCTDDECFDAPDLPAHQVTLSSFKIAIYPVTQKMWQAIMGSNPSFYFGDDVPVHGVSWDDVQEFIKDLNAATGKKYRLPTEAEWEYAARGGNQTMGYKYSGSDSINEVAWYQGNSGLKPHPVGTKKSNELGIYDMSGNVREWCQDGFYRYSADPQTNPQAPDNISRVVRGGSATDPILYPTYYCRVSARMGWHHSYRGGLGIISDLFGFRLVLPVDP